MKNARRRLFIQLLKDKKSFGEIPISGVTIKSISEMFGSSESADIKSTDVKYTYLKIKSLKSLLKKWSTHEYIKSLKDVPSKWTTCQKI